MSLKLDLPAGLAGLLDAIRTAGGRPYVVGGAVRDALLGVRVAEQDCDVEVFDLAPDALETVLSRAGRVDAVGQSFRVFKLSGIEGVSGSGVRMPALRAVSRIMARPTLGLPLPSAIDSLTGITLIERVIAWVSVMAPE